MRLYPSVISLALFLIVLPIKNVKVYKPELGRSWYRRNRTVKAIIRNKSIMPTYKDNSEFMLDAMRVDFDVVRQYFRSAKRQGRVYKQSC